MTNVPVNTEKRDTQSDKMKELLGLMVEDAELLYTAAIQYHLHAALLTGPLAAGFKDDLLGHAADDFGQAVVLADKVAAYGTKPAISIHQILEADDSLEMIKLDMQIQKVAAERYHTRIEQAKEVKEYSIVNLYMEMLSHEEEHLNETEAFLGEYGDTDPGNDHEHPLDFDGPRYQAVMARHKRARDLRTVQASSIR